MRRISLDRAWWATLAVIAAAFVLAAIGGTQTGTSWDENEHRRYGQLAVSFYVGRSRDATTDVMSYYGAFFAVLATIAEKLPFAHWAHARHFMTASFGALGLLYTARLARLFAGPWAGFAAAAFLALTPRYFGDAMFNPIDVPTAALYVVAVFYLARIALEHPVERRSLWVKAGIAIGLTLAVRVVGLFLLFYLGFLTAALAWLHRRPKRGAVDFVLALAVAWIVAAIFWPRFLVHPFGTIRSVLRMSADFPWTGAVFFRGAYHVGRDVPASYLPVWLWITMPPLVLAGLACAIAFRRKWLAERKTWLAAGVVVLSIVFAPLYALVTNATVYDGIRHFLFVLPPLAAIAGCGAAAAANLESRRRIAVGAFALLAAEPLWWYARSHPYEYVYFGPLAGGLDDASQRYDTDYWGLSMREAAEWLDENRVAIAGTAKVAVITNTSWQLLEPWLDDPSRYVVVREQGKPFHVFLESYRTRPPGWHLQGKPVHSFAPIDGQVPFWRVHLGPAARR